MDIKEYRMQKRKEIVNLAVELMTGEGKSDAKNFQYYLEQAEEVHKQIVTYIEGMNESTRKGDVQGS